MLVRNAIALTLTLCLAVVTPASSCSTDNCLREVRGNAEGTADCNSYFLATVTPATITITATVTEVISTTTSEITVVTSASTAVESFTAAQTTTVTLEDTETDIVTETLVFTTTVVPWPFAGFDKRQATFAPTSIPSYASACSGSVKYSSACSCIGATQATITAVAPSTTVTVTTTQTSVDVVSITSTVISVETDSTTLTIEQPTTLVLTTTTTLTTQTSITTTTYASPTCTSMVGPPFTYLLQYVGPNGLNPDNPANNNQTTPLFNIYSGTLNTCQAAQQCATNAANTPSNTPLGGGYFTINLQWHLAEETWVCFSYFDRLPDTSYYNVVNPDIGESYGWVTCFDC